MFDISVTHWWIFFFGLFCFVMFFLIIKYIKNKYSETYRFYVSKNRWFRISKKHFILWYTSSTLLILSAGSLLIAAMGISIVKNQTSISDTDKSILFLIDTSPSMAVQDIANNTRLDEIKKQLKVFLKSDVGAYVGIALFADAISLYIPFSNDYRNISYLIDEIHIGTLGDGTALSDALIYGDFLLSQTKSSTKQLILISDGIQNNSATSLNDIKQHSFTSLISLWKIGSSDNSFLEYTDPKTKKIIRGIVQKTNSTLLDQIYTILQDKKIPSTFNEITNKINLQNNILNFVHTRTENYSTHTIRVKEDISNYLLFMFLLCFSIFLIIRIFFMRSIQ